MLRREDIRRRLLRMITKRNGKKPKRNAVVGRRNSSSWKMKRSNLCKRKWINCNVIIIRWKWDASPASGSSSPRFVQIVRDRIAEICSSRQLTDVQFERLKSLVNGNPLTAFQVEPIANKTDFHQQTLKLRDMLIKENDGLLKKIEELISKKRKRNQSEDQSSNDDHQWACSCTNVFCCCYCFLPFDRNTSHASIVFISSEQVVLCWRRGLYFELWPGMPPRIILKGGFLFRRFREHRWEKEKYKNRSLIVNRSSDPTWK